MHVIDTLQAGGMERVAVNMVNALPGDRFERFLCATRRGGPLASLIDPQVTCLQLARRGRVDWTALWRLVSFIRSHRIQLIHAHGSSLFFAGLATLVPPWPVLVWHDHFGQYRIARRSPLLYRLAGRAVNGVVSVNEALAHWARQTMRVPSDRVWYIPNFIDTPQVSRTRPSLPGVSGRRIACIANLRPQKDHPTLLRALPRVLSRFPDAHLLLVGGAADRRYADTVTQLIREMDLSAHISVLGERDDVADILRSVDIAVLSSVSEGFPLSVVEYGLAGLPVVVTDVGQCAEIVDGGTAGLLVPPANPEALADAVNVLLASPEQRLALGERLKAHVTARYSMQAVMQHVAHIYSRLLDGTIGHDFPTGEESVNAKYHRFPATQRRAQ